MRRARPHHRPPAPAHPAEPALAWFVREAWPGSGTDFTVGRLDGDERLELTVTSDALVVFSDGGETDRLTAVRGQRVTVGLSSRRLRLVVPA